MNKYHLKPEYIKRIRPNNNKKMYLSTILDLYDRKVIAYKISKFNNNQLVIDTLN